MKLDSQAWSRRWVTPRRSGPMRSPTPIVWHGAQSFLNSASPDTYRFNADSFREGLAKAGFVEVSRGHPPDEDHSAEWVLMRFAG